MFEQLSTDELVRVAGAGAGFVLNAGNRSADDLVRIAGASSRTGARIIFAVAGQLSVNDVIRISGAGSGNISFQSTADG